MGLYRYSNPANEQETVEIVQSIHDAHVYSKDNVQWNRVWQIPNAAIDSKINPFSAKEFREKTSNKRETVGSLWDRSKEASLKREQTAGRDDVKERHYAKYSKKRRGLKHPDQIKTDTYTI